MLTGETAGTRTCRTFWAFGSSRFPPSSIFPYTTVLLFFKPNWKPAAFPHEQFLQSHFHDSIIIQRLFPFVQAGVDYTKINLPTWSWSSAKSINMQMSFIRCSKTINGKRCQCFSAWWDFKITTLKFKFHKEGKRGGENEPVTYVYSWKWSFERIIYDREGLQEHNIHML